MPGASNRGARGRGRSASNRWEPWQRDDWGPTAPIPVPDGLRAKSKRGAIGETWWSQRFVAALERLVDPGRLARGRNYARRGQVVRLDVEPGAVAAVVQGSRPKPYSVHLALRPLTDTDWGRAETAIASQAIFLARLLSGEMPDEIEEAFASIGLSLFPRSRGDLTAHCSCPDAANPCKHAAATYYLLAEAFDADPFLIFAWRGRPREHLLAELRAMRDAAAAEPDGPIETGSASDPDGHPADSTSMSFWEPGPGFAEVRFGPGREQRADALLREVAPLAPKLGFDLVGALAPAYETIADAARAMEFEPAAPLRLRTSPAPRAPAHARDPK